MLVPTNRLGKDAWLEGFSKNSVRTYRNGYEKFIQFMNETEDGSWDDKRLLKEREIDLQERNFAFEQKVVEFHRWLDRLPTKVAGNTKRAHITSICSFFAFHRMDLKFTKQQRSKIWKSVKPARKYYNFTVEDLKRMSQVANPKERYVLLAGKSLGLRASDFIQLKQGTFEAHLKGEAPVSLGDVYTQKEGVKASPFLDEDAIEASRTWLRILASRGERNAEARMISISNQEVDLIIKKLAKRAGIKIGDEIVRFHQLRVFLITRLSRVLETNRWKQLVGKRVPESAYVRPFNLRDDYAKVMPFTTVQERVAKDEVIKLKEEVATLKERETDARNEVDGLRREIRNLEHKLENVKKKLEKLELSKYPSWLEAYAPKKGDNAQTSEEIEEVFILEESEEE